MGTLTQLGNLIDRSMTAGDLAASPVWMVDPARRAADAAEVLSARGFDVAGVGIETPTHFVQTEAIRGRVGKVKRYAHPILAGCFWAAIVPL